MPLDMEEDDEWIAIPADVEETPPTNDEEDEWLSDVSDTDEEEESPKAAQRNREDGGNHRKRQAGHGSQRVKNKARKSDVKKLWQEAGWGTKPSWLTWRAALAWLQRGERPPRQEAGMYGSR